MQFEERNRKLASVDIPTKIAKIVLFFSSFNVLLSLLTFAFNIIFGLTPSPLQLFSSEAFATDSLYFAVAVISVLFANLIMVFEYVTMAENARMVIDYVLTVLLLHVLNCTFTIGFPKHFFFWAVHALAVTGVTLLAEFIVLRLEKRDISLNFKSFKDNV